MARQMVARFGMSEIIGLMAIGQADQEVFLGRELVQRREISEHTAQQVDQEIKRVLDEAQERARLIVTEHEDLLERLAQALLDRETLDSVEILLVEAGEELPPPSNGGVEADDGSEEADGDPGDRGELEADEADAGMDELNTASVEEADAQTEVPTAVKVGDEPSGDEETSPGTVRTPAVQLSAEDPEADASG